MFLSTLTALTLAATVAACPCSTTEVELAIVSGGFSLNMSGQVVDLRAVGDAVPPITVTAEEVNGVRTISAY